MRRIIAIAGSICIGLLLYISYIFMTLPDVEQIRTCFTTAMYSVRLCPNSPSYVDINKISSHLKNAVVITEDSAFYQHHGFDFSELRNSFSTNLERGGFVRGGSTLTQQLAKNVFLSSDKSITRKLKEAILTIQLEDRLSKTQILEKYLNVVEFGPNLFGVVSASRFYFQKSPGELNPLESAFLAFLLPNPKTHSASFTKGKLTPFAKKRLQQIVSRMAQYQRLSGDERAWALSHIDGFPWSCLGNGPIGTHDDSPILQVLERELEDRIEPASDESQNFESPFGDATEEPNESADETIED